VVYFLGCPDKKALEAHQEGCVLMSATFVPLRPSVSFSAFPVIRLDEFPATLAIYAARKEPMPSRLLFPVAMLTRK
jgi:hypothetical protein